MCIKNNEITGVDSMCNIPKQVYADLTFGSIFFENDGPDIINTNYWQSDSPRRGDVHLSINAGAFRMLVPFTLGWAIRERSKGSDVIISRGPWLMYNKSDAIEVLFNDDSDKPFTIMVLSNQLNPLPLDSSCDQRWMFSAWTKDGKKLELPCRYRIVDKLPCSKPF